MDEIPCTVSIKASPDQKSYRLIFLRGGKVYAVVHDLMRADAYTLMVLLHTAINDAADTDL